MAAVAMAIVIAVVVMVITVAAVIVVVIMVMAVAIIVGGYCRTRSGTHAGTDDGAVATAHRLTHRATDGATHGTAYGGIQGAIIRQRTGGHRERQCQDQPSDRLHSLLQFVENLLQFVTGLRKGRFSAVAAMLPIAMAAGCEPGHNAPSSAPGGGRHQGLDQPETS